MPRPKLKSDDEVLEAATVVLKRCGPIEFTLSGVAKEVGLSRAALIQRFTNRDTLLVRMMERGVEQVPSQEFDMLKRQLIANRDADS